jgi:hypothetical protein
MRLRLLTFFFFFLLAMWPAATLHADQSVKDDITQDRTWTRDNQPYVVTGNIKVYKDVTLKIEPGVTVKLAPNASLTVKGNMVAEARSNRPIVFTWRDFGQRWGSIHVEDSGMVRLNQVTVMHAKTGLLTTGYGEGTVVFTSVFRDNVIAIHNDMFGGDGVKDFTLDVTGTLITGNETGVLFTKGTTRLSGNNISENTSQGIAAFAQGLIVENTIYANGTDGIETVSRGGNPDLIIRYNTINYNGLGGLSLRRGELTGRNFLIEHNNIFGNGRYDLRWLSEGALNADKNFWGTHDLGVIGQRVVNSNYQPVGSRVKLHPNHHVLVSDAPAPLPAPAAAQAAAPAPAPAPAPVATAAPAPVVPRGPSITDPVPAKAGARYFGETGHNVEGIFRAFFENMGGISRFGYPRTEAIIQDGLRVQWFQGGRLEHHRNLAGTPYEVQLTLLGDRLTAPLRPFPTAPVPCGTTPNCRYFPETQHIVHGVFLEYFEQNGGLEAFGYPISELFRDYNSDGSGRPYTMQWFQRARLEHHPEIGPRVILLGLLGDEQLQVDGQLPR